MDLDWQTIIVSTIPSAGLIVLLMVIFFIYKFFSNKKSHQNLSQTEQQLRQQAEKEAQKWQELDRHLFLFQDRLKQIELQREQIEQLLKNQQQEQVIQRQRFDEYQIQSLKLMQESLQMGMSEVRSQVTTSLNHFSQELNQRVEKLTHDTQNRLKEISSQVDQRLMTGFEKTTATFMDVMKRLSIIDEAQKKITELSGNVISLQEILQDKKSRGTFGEVQLTSLIRNIIPETHFSLQHTLSNGKRVDCFLLLPEPTGNIAIDAKFPLENYRILVNPNTQDSDRRQAEQQFRQDIRKHIQDISQKYIISGETADGAVMFIPAESIFAEIHAKYPDLVENAYQARVWMVSPTTMAAILTTARAVLKDAATRKQVHIIQKHLSALGKDFERFQNRMDNLARHINQAHEDIGQVHLSSQKISGRFSQIEKVEFEAETTSTLIRNDT